MAAPKEYADGASHQPSKQSGVTFKSVLVSNIPPWMDEAKLTIHFQKTSNGGGDVNSIKFMITANTSVAVVTFENPKCAYDVLMKSQTTDRGEILKVELYTEVFGEVNAVLPEGILYNLRGPLLDKIKKGTGVYLKRDNLKVSISGSWNQVEAARRIIQLHLSPDYVDQAAPSLSSNTAVGPAEAYNPNRYLENPDDLDRLRSTCVGVHPREQSEGPGEDMEWEDETGASPSTPKSSASVHIPSHHLGGSSLVLNQGTPASLFDTLPESHSLTMSPTDEEDQRKFRRASESSRRYKVESSHGPHSLDPHLSGNHGETSPTFMAATNMQQNAEEYSKAGKGKEHRKGNLSSSGVPGLTRPEGQSAVLVHASLGKGKSREPSDNETNNQGDSNDDTLAARGSQGDDYFTVDPYVLHILQQTRGSELQKSLTQNHVRLLPTMSNTSVQFVPISRSQSSNLEKARNTFVDLYQEVFSSLKYEEMDISAYGIPSYEAKKALERVKEVYSLVQMAEVKDRIFTFYGVESDVREARKALCKILKIPSHRSQRMTKQNSVTRNDNSTDITQPVPGTSASSMLQGSLLFECNLNGVKVTIMNGDITKQHVDVIVNASDVDLTHGGGVAAAIIRAGGHSIQADCSNHFYSQGSLKETECMWTTAGSLPCRHVIHAAGPTHHNSSTLQKLKMTCLNAFAKAEELKATSIALPAISTGMYGVPADLCAQAMLEAITDFTQHGTTSLHDISIVDINLTTVQNIATYFRRYSGTSPTAYSVSSRKRTSPPSTTSSAGSSAGYIRATQGSNPERSYADAARFGGGASGFGQGNQSSSHGKKPHTQSLGKSTTASTSSPTEGVDDKDDKCPICLDDITDPKTLPQCKHKFCKDCLDQALKASSQCPICKVVVGTLTGTQPRGTMKDRVDRSTNLPGYPYCSTIVIDYHFQSGTQGPEHPNPGRRYGATSRRAYLPDNWEGREVLALLRRAFNQRLVFTVGTSATTGLADNVVWNDIHHKTNTHGGPTNYGYPDPDYLRRVKEELAAKGIK